MVFYTNYAAITNFYKTRRKIEKLSKTLTPYFTHSINLLKFHIEFLDFLNKYFRISRNQLYEISKTILSNKAKIQMSVKTMEYTHVILALSFKCYVEKKGHEEILLAVRNKLKQSLRE